MFLLAITKKDVTSKIQNLNYRKIKTDHQFINIFTDGNFSRFINKQDEFLLIESLNLFKNDDFKKIQTVLFNKDKNLITVFRPFTLGRPIYYFQPSLKEFFLFTHIDLLRKFGITLEENSEVLPELFTYRYLFPPKTLFKNIKQLSMGDTLKIKIFYENIKIKQINHYKFQLNNKIKYMTIDTAAKELNKNLYGLINELNGDKNNITTLLSGGIDSSILAKIGKNIFGNIDTYSSGYPFEKDYSNDEKKYAYTAAKSMKLNHKYHEIKTNDYLKALIDSINKVEQPLHHLQSVCLYLLYKKGIPSEKNIIIEGWGAGGAFGNFRNYLYYKNRYLFKIGTKFPLFSGFKLAFKIFNKNETLLNQIHKSKRKLQLNDPNHPLWSYHDYGSKEWVCNYFNVLERNIIRNQYNSMKRFQNLSEYDLFALYSLYGDEDITISQLSKLSEANNKFHFFPFYDNKILETVFSLPWSIKLMKPENILRKRMAEHLGIQKFIINRPKRGFGVSHEIWGKENGVFEPLIPLVKKIIPINEIRKLQKNHDLKHAMIYWNIINYAIWKRLYINGDTIELLYEELNNYI